MRVLVATSIYPTSENPSRGTFVRTQVEYLKRAGVEVELFHLKGPSRKLMYPKAVLELRQRLRASPIDLIHAHYSYVGIVARTQWRVPVVVSYCGDDLLGTMNMRGKPTLFSRLAVFAGRLLSHQVDGVIVKSREMADRLKRKKDVYVIPHEVDFEHFRPMARNLPIVSTDVGDVREIMGRTDRCYVCEPDAREFTERLADILRHRQRTRGRERVQHLSGPAVAQRIIQVYEQVLRNHGGRTAHQARTGFL